MDKGETRGGWGISKNDHICIPGACTPEDMDAYQCTIIHTHPAMQTCVHTFNIRTCAHKHTPPGGGGGGEEHFLRSDDEQNVTNAFLSYLQPYSFQALFLNKSQVFMLKIESSTVPRLRATTVMMTVATIAIIYDHYHSSNIPFHEANINQISKKC